MSMTDSFKLIGLRICTDWAGVEFCTKRSPTPLSPPADGAQGRKYDPKKMDQLPCLSLSRSVVYLFEYISDITRKTISLASNIWQCTRRRARPSWQGSSLSASQLFCRGPYLFLSTTKKHDHESRLHLTPRPMVGYITYINRTH